MQGAEVATLVKLGGSLLSNSDVAERLLAFLDTHRTYRPIVVVGGGETANLVRHWDQRFALSASQAHSLAIHAMSLNARLLCTLHERLQLISSAVQAENIWKQRRIPVLDVAPALHGLANGEPPHVLVHSWDVTSDSIAAWLVVRFSLRTLCLVKSTDPPAVEISRIAKLGGVDAMFCQYASEIESVVWANLNSPNFPMTRLR